MSKDTEGTLITVSGPINGNAFAVLGACRKAALRAGWTREEWKIVEDEAKSGDYDHLLATLMEHFHFDL